MFAKLQATAIHNLLAEFVSTSRSSILVCLMDNLGVVTPANKLVVVFPQQVPLIAHLDSKHLAAFKDTGHS